MMTPLLASLLLLGAAPAADPRQDLLEAMAVELERNQATLRLKEDAGPYFISYQLKDYHQREVAARYGALFQDDDQHDRRLAVDVRVGSYGYDSSVGEDFDFSFSTKGTSYLIHKNAPLDDSPAALRTALWLITDEKYKAALFNYLKKKGEDVYTVEDPRRPPSFAHQAKAVAVGPRVPFPFAHQRWEALARALSARLAAKKELFDSEVRISAAKTARLYVNTEGTRLVTEDTLYSVHVQAWTRADDGQLLENSRDWYAPNETQLPDDARLDAAVEAVAGDLVALRAAPTIDPYTGPAILEPDAAGVLFHEAVGHRLEGERQDNDTEGKTFRGQVGKPVLPAFLSIRDDPTVRARGEVPLNGYYRFDEEGVPAQGVLLVEDGVLRSYLLSRRPVEGFLASNGHGRAQGNRKPVARMANLIVESKKKVSEAELKRQLVAEAKRQGKPYGLIIRDIIGGNTNTQSFGYQAFKGIPRMVYRVDVETGQETLVRGVEIVGTPLSSVNRVLATGTQEGVFNGYCGAESGMVPVSTVAPAVLLQEIELQRALEGKDRPPLLPSPFPAR
jgi:TldD protein